MATILLDGREFRITGRVLRTMALRDDLLDDIQDPETVANLSRKGHVPADILTFSQHLPDLSPKFSYCMEWDNLAAVPISTYEYWLMKQIHPNTRNKINKARRAGIVVEIEELTRRLAEGIVGIFNETPVRRGRLYSYYGRDVETVEKEWSKDSKRSDFLVAYYQNEIIGFIQLVYGKGYARTSGTVAKISHRNKAPMNALISKAVETCAEKKIPFLVYGKYIYGQKSQDSLTIFKQNNGFKKFDVPRYYIPLSLRGKLGLRLGLHHGIFELFPNRAQRLLSKIRFLWYERLTLKK